MRMGRDGDLESFPADGARNRRRAKGSGPAFWLVPVAGQIIVLALAISLMPFAHPQADDFCRSGSVMQQGLIESLRSEYMGWSGRWSGTGMSYVVPLFADVTHTYGLILLAAMGVLGSGVYSLVSALVAGDTPRSVRLFATATILAIHWSGNHATGDNYYWLPGAFEYHLGVALGFLLLAAMLKNPPRGGVGAGGGWRIALSSVGALFIAGMHELYAAMLCGVLAVGTVVALKERDPRRFLWASVLGAGLTGFLVVFFAPGNQVRSPSWVAIDYALAVAARQAWGVVKGWLIDTKLLSATALLAAAVHLDYIRPR
ncbi:MAG TPA: hypothetical protein VJA25_09300, partial [Dehalococcoidia bacterium]|nr:hypothetical protein [Dehalococcoidia bacterium]